MPTTTTLSTRVHRVEQLERLVDLPVVAEERLLGEEEVLAVLHVEDGVRLERVLVVARRDVGAHEWRRPRIVESSSMSGENDPRLGAQKYG